MFKVRANRPEEGERIVSIWRAAVAATHEFLLPEDRKGIDVEAQAYLLSAALWVAVDPQDQPVAFMGLGAARLEALFVHLSIRSTAARALAGLWSRSQRPCIRSWTQRSMRRTRKP
jgi:putative acetyltransferase